MATCSSILAWKTPWTEKPGGLQSMGSQSPWDITEHTHTHTHTHTEVLATTMVIIILQYINMSDQHILHLKLTQSKMFLYLNKSYM